jgi:predicted RNA-binding protein with TRAM domain
MADCPLAEECPSFTERIEGMGCTHYGDRGGAEWCNHYNQPIEDLKSQPVKPGEELVVEIEDIHESGAGVGRTEDGFIIMVDGVLPPARARIEVTQVMSNHARAKELERLPEDPEAEADDSEGKAKNGDDEVEATSEEANHEDDDTPHLGSRDNFWGS